MSKIRVMVVDDSALVRSLLAGIVNAQSDMTCIGAASDPYEAREMIRNLDPDVLTLDVEMPRMDGIDFLEKLMRLRPMCSCVMPWMTAAPPNTFASRWPRRPPAFRMSLIRISIANAP